MAKVKTPTPSEAAKIIEQDAQNRAIKANKECTEILKKYNCVFTISPYVLINNQPIQILVTPKK